MLDIDARLARQAIGIAVDKALEDVKGNTRRGIRNLIDLGLLFSQSENQKWFFGAAKQVIENPKNPYKALVSRVVRDIEPETIRRVGINLGYNALTYGVKKLRKKQEALGVNLPWMLDVGEDSEAEFEPRLDCCLLEGARAGHFQLCPAPDGPGEPARCGRAHAAQRGMLLRAEADRRHGGRPRRGSARPGAQRGGDGGHWGGGRPGRRGVPRSEGKTGACTATC